MFFKSKRHFLSDQKIRFKMPKLPKRWLAVGITFLGLCLGIGISATQVQATPQPVQTVNSKVISPQPSSKAAIAPTNVLNSKASVKAKSPNSRLGSPFVPRVGLKDHLHNRCCGSNCNEDDECGCEDDDDECECGDDDDECGDCDSNDDDEIKLNNKKKDIYWGQDYTVEGTIASNEPNHFKGRLRYFYYIFGSGDTTENDFTGPQNVGSNPETFKFTIPHEKMVPGNKYEIYVFVEDENQELTNSTGLKLIPHAEIKTVDKTYYAGDPFDQFGNFAGGLNVTNQPLTKEEITKTVIRNDNDKMVVPKEKWNEITANPGKYIITYIYKYGSEDECGCSAFPSGRSVCNKAEINVIDRKKITLKYVDESLKPIEDKYLDEIPEEMKSGPHEKPYGSKFPLVKTPELLLDGKKYYEFVRFEYAVRPAPDLTEDYVTFGDYDQVINVVYKDLRAKAPIKVELINIKNPADKIENTIPNTSPEIDRDSGHLVYTINPKNTELFPLQPSVDESINLKNYIKQFDSANPPANNDPKLTLPKDYTIASKPELEKLGLKQEEPKFGLEEVKTQFYVVKNEATYNFKIHHIVRGSDVEVPGLRATKQEVKPEGPFTIDTNDRAHLAPRGYRIIGASLTGSRVDRKYPFNPRTGLITGTVPDKTKFDNDGENSYKDVYIVYDKY